MFVNISQLTLALRLQRRAAVYCQELHQGRDGHPSPHRGTVKGGHFHTSHGTRPPPKPQGPFSPCRYEAYLVDHPGSLLLRILGAHCLRSYSSVFYFFVMENLFNIADEQEDADDDEEGASESPRSQAAAQAAALAEKARNDNAIKTAMMATEADENEDEGEEDDEKSVKAQMQEQVCSTPPRVELFVFRFCLLRYEARRASKADWLTGFSGQERHTLETRRSSM